jgi:hypothetical protein
MADAFESKSEMSTAAERPHGEESYERPNRLGQTAAWVGIVAGVVFVVAVIFFSGVLLARSSDDFGWRRDGWSEGAGGKVGTCPMMAPGEMGPMGPRSGRP